jgi:hypothetical protein
VPILPRPVRALAFRAFGDDFLRRFAGPGDFPATRSSATVRLAGLERLFSKDGSMRLAGAFLRGMKDPDAVSDRCSSGSKNPEIDMAAGPARAIPRRLCYSAAHDRMRKGRCNALKKCMYAVPQLNPIERDMHQLSSRHPKCDDLTGG